MVRRLVLVRLQPRPDDARGVAIGAHGQPPAPWAARRRRAPRAARASRNEVENWPCRSGCRRSRRPVRSAGRGSGEEPPRFGDRVRAVGSRARADRGRRRSRDHPPHRLVSRQEANVRCPATFLPALGIAGAHEEPIRPGIEAGRVAELREGLARWSAAPAASHPRRGRCRAGSCAPRRGIDPRTRRQGGHTPPCHLAELGSRDRYPSPFRMTASVQTDALTRYGRRAPMGTSIFGSHPTGRARKTGRRSGRRPVVDAVGGSDASVADGRQELWWNPHERRLLEVVGEADQVRLVPLPADERHANRQHVVDVARRHRDARVPRDGGGT